MGITTYSQLNGDSWGAVRLSPDFSPQLAGKKYSVTLDAQFGIVTGTTVNDFWLGLGILGVGEAAQVPTSSNTDFGIRINASGGGYGIYSDGSSVSNATTGSTLTFNERFTLTLIVDETGALPSVQVLIQGAGDTTATDLGTYGFDFDAGETERSFSLRVNQTNTSGNSSDNGVLYLDTYDMSVVLVDAPLLQSATVTELSAVSGNVFKMVVDAPSALLHRYYPAFKTDLFSGGSWTNRIAHSDNSGGPFSITNLSHSTAEGTNVAIYLEGDTSQKFFRISAD